jgi:tRNA threonylcarbamoyladenosine biosynthesis protein TsaB
MKLLIDTTDSKKTIVGLDDQHWEFKTKKQKSQQLLTLIDQVLKKKKKSLKDITEIEINLGPGSFTGLRVGVSVANALSWTLKIPINGQKVGQLVEPKYEGVDK